jgi:hypothetical protein
VDGMSTPWPVAGLDNIRRLHVMAAIVRGARVTERIVDAPMADVWTVLTDFDSDFARVQPDMRRVRVLLRDGERVSISAVSRRGFRARLHGTVRPGWCWLQSRFLIIAMAATSQPDGRTRVALTGGVRVPGRSVIVPIGVRREARRSLDRLETMLARRR